MEFFTPLILAVQMLISFDADLYEIIGLSLQVSLVQSGSADAGIAVGCSAGQL